MTYLSSTQSYSMGHSSRPVVSCLMPRLSRDEMSSGSWVGCALLSQLATASLIDSTSSPRASLAPFSSLNSMVNAENNEAGYRTHSAVKFIQVVGIGVVQIVLQLRDEVKKLFDCSVAAFPTKALISKLSTLDSLINVTDSLFLASISSASRFANSSSSSSIAPSHNWQCRSCWWMIVDTSSNRVTSLRMPRPSCVLLAVFLRSCFSE